MVFELVRKETHEDPDAQKKKSREARVVATQRFKDSEARLHATEKKVVELQLERYQCS